VENEVLATGDSSSLGAASFLLLRFCSAVASFFLILASLSASFSAALSTARFSFSSRSKSLFPCTLLFFLPKKGSIGLDTTLSSGLWNGFVDAAEVTIGDRNGMVTAWLRFAKS
jgi:hypothetical protein